MSNRLAVAIPHEQAPPQPATAERLLMVWLSPGFPVGAFAFSHGLDWAVEAGLVRDRATLTGWLAALLVHGSARNDLILLATAHGSSASGAGLSSVAELAVALQPSGERHLETTMQGNAFITAMRSAWPCAAIDALAASWPGDVAYPVAVGVAAAGHAIPLRATLEAYAVGFVKHGRVGLPIAAPPRLGEPDRAQGVAGGLRRRVRVGARLGRDPALRDRPDRRPADHRRPDAGHRRRGGRSPRVDTRRYRWRCLDVRLVLARPRNPVYQIVPLMTLMAPVSVAAALVLALIAAVHAIWAFGSTWPTRDELTLARTVVGRTGIRRMPPRWASALVAALLMGVAAHALALAGIIRIPLPARLVDAGGFAVALVFLVRGLAAYLPSWRRLASEQPFARLDQTCYGPLCLALGTAFLSLIWPWWPAGVVP